MKSDAQLAYEKVQKTLHMAPGMIEECEKRLLFKTAFNCRDLPAVEFGAFFGASTLALAHGLSEGQSNPHPLICIDAFEVEADHGFHKHVINHAKRCQGEHLLQKTGSKTNWIEITKAVLGDQKKNVRLIKGVVNNNFNMTILPKRIGLLHLDLPKDAKTIWPILKGVFPRLTQGSVIAFQDYAYQFSNELISLFELLEQREHIKAINIAASSIFYEVKINTFSADTLASILQEAVKNQTKLINDAIHRYKKYSNSRPKEIIALHAAAICAVMAQTDSSPFEKKKEIRNLILMMTDIDKQWGSRYLTELLTEEIERHK